MPGDAVVRWFGVTAVQALAIAATIVLVSTSEISEAVGLVMIAVVGLGVPIALRRLLPRRAHPDVMRHQR